MTGAPIDDDQPRASSFRTGWRALIALTDERDAARLVRALPPTVDPTRVSPADAFAVAGDRSFQLIFADLADAELLHGTGCEPRPQSPCPLLYLTTADSLEPRWPKVVRFRVRTLVDIELVDDPVLFEPIVESTLGGLRIDLQSLFGGADSVTARTIDKESRRTDAVSEVLHRLQEFDPSQLQLTHYRLVLEEILNNAMRHASSAPPSHGTDDGQEVGRSGGVDQIKLTSLVTPEVFAVNVTDGAGMLTGEMVRNAISHQLAGEGDFDGSGRGLFIAYSLANLLSVAVDPGQRTDVLAIFRHALPKEHKALIVNASA